MLCGRQAMTFPAAVSIDIFCGVFEDMLYRICSIFLPVGWVGYIFIYFDALSIKDGAEISFSQHW